MAVLLFSLLRSFSSTLLPLIGVEGLGWNSLFGIVVPYVALATFVAGFIYRVLKWGSAPVPFHIPTVCGQQKSLPWIKASKIDSPYDNERGRCKIGPRNPFLPFPVLE